MLMDPAAHLYPVLSFNIQMLMLAFLNKFSHVLRGMQSLIPLIIANSFFQVNLPDT